ncbi:sugar transferase [Planctomonas psychrotolerans]|uniref:sugar transferase n=1 Tax=Planctomonas psychrotolerans TaxID=2528712 RepID=UPI00123A1F59|nr:sugar transferase [Planctomonas psychrotolerans]
MGVAAALSWQRAYSRRLLLSDFAAVLIAMAVSQLVWFGTGTAELRVRGDGFPPFRIAYELVSVVVASLWLILLGTFGTRDFKVVGSGSTEYRRVVDATLRMFGGIAIVMFLLQVELGRGYFLTALPLGLLLLLVGRWIWRKWLIAQRVKGKYSHRTLLLGDRLKSEHVAMNIRNDPAAGLQVVGALTRVGSTERPLEPGVPVVGDFNDLSAVLDTIKADTVIITGSDHLGPRLLREIGWDLEARKVSLVVAPALTDIAGPRIHARPVAGLPLIHVDYPTFEGRKHLAKRTFDIIMSGTALAVLSPVFLVLALIVRGGSTGPAFFRQERVGLNGRTFQMVKFRSMVTDAEAILPSLLDQSDGNGVLFKLKSDPRVTKAGAVLRRYSLDELPQLINVFRGEMSLVGPRPPLASEVDQYDGWAQRRLLVKPGITGLWQVSGRSDLSWEDSVRLDLYYVENWSLTGDLMIIYRTGRAVLRSSGAY